MGHTGFVCFKYALLYVDSHSSVLRLEKRTFAQSLTSTYCFVPSSSFSISVVAQLVRAYDQPVKSTSSLRWSGRRLSRLQIRLCPPRLASNAPKTSPQPRRWSPPPYKQQQQEPPRPPKPSSMQPEYQPPGQIPDGPPRPRRQELSQPQLLRRHPARPSRTCLP